MPQSSRIGGWILSNGKAGGWQPEVADHRDQLFKGFKPRKAVIEPVSLKEEFLPLVRDQLNLGSCHKADTEVLTDRGWRLFADLDGSERLGTVNPKTAELFFEYPIRLIRKPYQGPLVCTSGQSVDFAVTPDHVMLVRKWDESRRTLSDDYTFVEAGQVGWYFGLMNRIVWKGEGASDVYTLPGVVHRSDQAQCQPREVPMGLWLRLLGFYLADGTLLKRDQRPGCVSYVIQFATGLPSSRKKPFIREVLDLLGFRYFERDDRTIVNNKQLYEALSGLGLEGVRSGKKFAPAFVFRQSADMIEEFLLGHFMGDGCQQEGVKSSAHYTSSTQLADDLQRLIFLSGKETVLSVREAREARLADGRVITGTLPEHRISVRTKDGLSLDRKTQILTEEYEGEVFCAEVPSYHTLVTRRNGRILVSGNCTGHGVRGCLLYSLRQKGDVFRKPGYDLSPLFAYYQARVLEDSVNEDAGAYIRDVVKAAFKLGIATESSWPYKIERFAHKPTETAHTTARWHQIKGGYKACLDVDDILQALTYDTPVVFGYSVFSNHDAGQVGRIPMPGPRDRMEGGHCQWIVAGDPKTREFKIQNSWGVSYGDRGYNYLPFEYFDRGWADDAWACLHE